MKKKLLTQTNLWWNLLFLISDFWCKVTANLGWFQEIKRFLLQLVWTNFDKVLARLSVNSTLLWRKVLSSIELCLNHYFHRSTPEFWKLFAKIKNILRWLFKNSSLGFKNQRRHFKIPAKSFWKASEEFLFFQLRASKLSVKGCRFSS